jgi:glyoxylase-like metal-dependent hydrolase (beta-lactamase superfamily II)
LAHLYWLADRKELNLVTSETAAANLPPRDPTTQTGSFVTSVTQLDDKQHVNGMGYVVQLADGSFIVYDGGYDSQVSTLWGIPSKPKKLGVVDEIVIRAWVLTHFHDDHIILHFGLLLENMGHRFGWNM